MESHMSRFRIPLASKKFTTRAASSNQLPASRVGAQNSNPSFTNNRFELPWSSSSSQCASCGGNKLRRVLSEITALQARLAWMESLINRAKLFGDGQNIEQVPTGTEAPNLGTGTSSELVCSSKMPSAERDSNRDSAHGTQNDEPPAKRLRLSIDSDQPGSDDTLIAASTETPRYLKLDVYSLMDAYFRDVNRTYPFIHRDAVIATLQKKETSIFNLDLRDVDATIAYLVIAIGYASIQRTEQDQASKNLAFPIDYKHLLAEYLTQETIGAVQVLLLLAIYSQFDPSGCTAWPIVDILARKAIRLGLTRRDTAEEGCLPEEAERRRRLFWSIYVWDRIVAMSTGVSVALDDTNMDIPLPGITIDEFASANRLEHTSVLQVSRHIIQLRMLEDKVLGEIHLRDRKDTRGLTQADRRGIANDLRTEIENWYSNGCLLKSTGPDEAMVHIRISWLSARYYNLLLLLYYPSHFNPTTSLVSRNELVSLAQKHVQATAVRWQQQHLPLNQLTLCRLFPVCMIFLHCFLSHSHKDGKFPARDEVSICAEIMTAFPKNWKLAHKSAAVLGQLASLITASSTCDPATPFSASMPQPLSEADRVWLHAVKVSLTELAEQVMGKGSTFCRWDYGGEQGAVILQPISRPAFTVGIDPIHRPGVFEAQDTRQQTNLDIGADQMELPVEDMYLCPSGISILDFS